MGSREIAGYSYKSVNLMAHELLEKLIAEGVASPDASSMSAEDVLDQLAAADGIDREDDTSYDRSDFPMRIYVTQLTPVDDAWYQP